MGHEASQFAPIDPDLEDENMLVDIIPIVLAEIIAEEKAEPQAQCTSILTGHGYVDELFEGNMHSFRTVARMDKQTFMRLVTLLRSAGLDDTPHISMEEKILVLIQVCVGLSNRQIAHRFQHSGDTISQIVREVCAVMRSVNHLFMVVPDATTHVEARTVSDEVAMVT